MNQCFTSLKSVPFRSKDILNALIINSVIVALTGTERVDLSGTQTPALNRFKRGVRYGLERLKPP